MKNTTSRTRRLLLSKNFILMVVMLVVIIVAISAWFTVNKTVTANNMTIKSASMYLAIADVVKTYNSDGTIKTEGPGVFSSTLDVNGIELHKDCTGNGALPDGEQNDGMLIIPEFNVTNDYDRVRINGGKDVNVNVGGNPATSNLDSENTHKQHPNDDAPEYQYFEKEFYIRSKNPQICLDQDSVLISKTESDGSVLTTITNPRDPNQSTVVAAAKQSAYGENLNVDGLVGAIRVALIGQECTGINEDAANNFAAPSITAQQYGTAYKQLTWLPRPDVCLHIPEESGDITNWKLYKIPATNNYNNTKHTYYRNTANGVELVEDNTALLSSSTVTESNVTIPSLGQQASITKFSQGGTQFDESHKVSLAVDRNAQSVVYEQYFLAKYTVKIWIEGSDAEARRAMDGGEFSLKLLFR